MAVRLQCRSGAQPNTVPAPSITKRPGWALCPPAGQVAALLGQKLGALMVGVAERRCMQLKDL